MILGSRTLLLLTLFAACAFARSPQASAQEKVRRNFEIEWEAIEGASLYELKLTRKGESGKKPVLFKTKDTKWSATIKPGTYIMQLRSYDDRGAPGEWAPGTDLEVKLPSVVQSGPHPNEVINATDENSQEVKLKWESVPGAEKYKAMVRATNGSWQAETETSNLNWSPKVPVGEALEWNVTGIDANGQVGDLNANAIPFEVKGPAIHKPSIEKPISKFVREIQWDPSPKAKTYSYELSYRNPKTKKWEQIETEDDITDTKVVLDIARPSGKYRLKVQAKGDRRAPSKMAQIDFETHGGFRDPAALETAIVRDSIVKPTNYYAIASCLITDVQYQAASRDQDQGSGFQAVGGTGRVGLGYQDVESPWGGFGIVDMSGFSIGGQSYTFTSAEAHVTHKLEFGQSGLILFGAGLFSKELPIVIGSVTTGFVGAGKVREIGPHAGFTYWMPINERYGMQTNARAYYTLTGSTTGTASSEKAMSSLSYQLGLLGTYRISKAWMGFAGYAYRKDEAQYESTHASKFNPSGAANTVDLQGHYLNLLMEFSF
jgi:hypothetical protein